MFKKDPNCPCTKCIRGCDMGWKEANKLCADLIDAALRNGVFMTNFSEGQLRKSWLIHERES